MFVKTLMATAGCMLGLAAAGCLEAADVSSGIPSGERVGSYSTTKCGGIDDGIDAGKSLCYT